MNTFDLTLKVYNENTYLQVNNEKVEVKNTKPKFGFFERFKIWRNPHHACNFNHVICTLFSKNQAFFNNTESELCMIKDGEGYIHNIKWILNKANQHNRRWDVRFFSLFNKTLLCDTSQIETRLSQAQKLYNLLKATDVLNLINSQLKQKDFSNLSESSVLQVSAEDSLDDLQSKIKTEKWDSLKSELTQLPVNKLMSLVKQLCHSLDVPGLKQLKFDMETFGQDFKQYFDKKLSLQESVFFVQLMKLFISIIEKEQHIWNPGNEMLLSEQAINQFMQALSSMASLIPTESLKALLQRRYEIASNLDIEP